jgi:hypothetical protein
MGKQINKDQLKPGQLIQFKNSRGDNAIGKIHSIADDFDQILMFDMILINDFSPLKGRFGGLSVSISQIIQILPIL